MKRFTGYGAFSGIIFYFLFADYNGFREEHFLSRRDTARQFIAGAGCPPSEVPAGTKYEKQTVFSRPSGTEKHDALRPGSELPGYFQVSLRDKTLPGQDAVFRSPGRDEV
ncbi:hypothetical protein QUF80_13750 [Desulfococcaceae bacterium HSG8]|nr:hypothetical protein [Desulfococcaceae bacterium HSG8]